MAREQLGTVLQFIRRAVGARDASTDADLLDRFATQREEAAFTALLQRHGPMVLGVCRRVLDNAADADDALQATFLVLVRRAGSIRKSASVASWLHGVALRVALEARTRSARRRTHERRAEVVVQTDAPGAEATRELRAILDEELEQLPAKYRSPLVLHYFEGKTKDETARQLGWSEGTVSGRLARARDLLRNRLGRRGLPLSGGMVAAALAREEATGKERVSVKGHPNRMLSLAFSPDGKTLATSGETVKLWEVETGKEKLELRVAERPWQFAAWSLAFSPDGKTLATGPGRDPWMIRPVR